MGNSAVKGMLLAASFVVIVVGLAWLAEHVHCIDFFFGRACAVSR